MKKLIRVFQGVALAALLSSQINATTIPVTVTAYTSHRNQTSAQPFVAAWGHKLKPHHKKTVIAVSRDIEKKYHLKNGSKVYLKTKYFKGYVTVRDRMNKRFKNRIDLYFYLSKKEALKWGVRKGTITF